MYPIKKTAVNRFAPHSIRCNDYRFAVHHDMVFCPLSPLTISVNPNRSTMQQIAINRYSRKSIISLVFIHFYHFIMQKRGFPKMLFNFFFFINLCYIGINNTASVCEIVIISYDYILTGGPLSNCCIIRIVSSMTPIVCYLVK